MIVEIFDYNVFFPCVIKLMIFSMHLMTSKVLVSDDGLESVCSAAIFNIEAAQSASKLADSNALWLKYSNPQSQHTHTITVTTLKARLLWNAQKFSCC